MQTKTMKSRLQAIGMKYFKRMTAITRRYGKRNDQIRQELNVEQLIKATENQFKWIDHLITMKETRQVKNTDKKTT